MFRLQMLILMEIAALTGMFTRIIVRFPYLWRDTLCLMRLSITQRFGEEVKFPPRLLLLVSVGKCLSLHLYNIVVELSTASGIQYQGNTFHQSR